MSPGRRPRRPASIRSSGTPAERHCGYDARRARETRLHRRPPPGPRQPRRPDASSQLDDSEEGWLVKAPDYDPVMPVGAEWLFRETQPHEVFTPERLSDEHRLIGQTAAEFVAKEVAPAL